MRKTPTPGGQFPFRIYYDDLNEIDQICLEVLQQHGLLPLEPSPIRVERLFDKHFRCTTHYEDLGVGNLGCTAFLPTGEVEAVFIARALAEDNSAVAKRRVRATFAHEAGHGLLHGCLFIDDGQTELFGPFAAQKERRILCRDQDIGSQTSRWWEFQANRAIGGLLLPKELVRQVVAPFTQGVSPHAPMMLAETVRDSAARELVRHFDVNPAVARIRLGEMYLANASATLC